MKAFILLLVLIIALILLVLIKQFSIPAYNYFRDFFRGCKEEDQNDLNKENAERKRKKGVT